MKFLRSTPGLGARLIVTTAGALAVAGLAACGDGNGGQPLIRATINVASITQQGNCEEVGVKVTPVQILPNPPQMANNREFVTSITLAKQADNVSCTGSAATIPMAPGKWKFTVMLPSEIASCERDIAPGGNLNVNFKDGDLSCT